jgi:cytochrome P450
MYAEAIIKSDEDAPAKNSTVVTAMVEAMRTKTPLLSRATVRHNIIALLLAGHEALSNCFAYAVSLASQNNGLIEAIRAESKRAESCKANGLSDLERVLPITGQVLQEAMRLCPPLPALLRRATQDVTVLTSQGSVTLPKGSEVLLDIFHAQRDASVWGVGKTGFSELDFKPERWEQRGHDNTAFAKQEIEAQMPCLSPNVFISTHLAKAQGLLVISRFIGTFSLSAGEGVRRKTSELGAAWRPGQRFYVEVS